MIPYKTAYTRIFYLDCIFFSIFSYKQLALCFKNWIQLFIYCNDITLYEYKCVLLKSTMLHSNKVPFQTLSSIVYHKRNTPKCCFRLK